MNHQKHTELTHKISELKRELNKCQEIVDVYSKQCESLNEELDKAEIELINLDLEGEPISDPYHKVAEKVHGEYVKEKEDYSKELQEKADHELDEEEITLEEQDEASRQQADDLEASRGQY
jgi:chromosome segregation ATPase